MTQRSKINTLQVWRNGNRNRFQNFFFKCSWILLARTGHPGTGEMAWWVKFLSGKLMHLSLDPEHTGKKPGMTAGACNN